MMRSDALRPAEDFLRALPRREGGTPVLAAVSGGVDSMSLLHFLTTWGAENGFAATAAHFHHHLRGADADRDERFVRDWCTAHDIPFVSGDGDTRALAEREHLTIEEAARNLRYAFLRRTVAERGCVYLMTAHHADDNAETMLLNLLRGTGSAGLAGIPALRDGVCRPFLAVTRVEIEAYAAENGVPHVEDATNGEDTASRNVLRHQVLPVLKTLNPRAVENLSRASRLLREESAVLDDCAAELLADARFGPDWVELPRQVLRDAPEVLGTRAILSMAARVCGCRKDLTAAHAEAVLTLARTGQTDAQWSLPYGMRARNAEQTLRIERAAEVPSPQPIVPGKTVRFGAWTVGLDGPPLGGEVFVLDALALRGAPLNVTGWRREDRMTLPGSRGPRSLKRLCADAGLSPAERDCLPVLRVGGQPAAVPGVGRELRFTPSPGRAAVIVTFIKNDMEGKYHEK